MDWATNSRGEEVRAGTRDANGSFLRCPVCKLQVYHRSGQFRRPHFAHLSGNSNQACELYHPGAGDVGGANASPTWTRPGTVAPTLGSPALIWRDGEPIPISLALRLPRFPEGYASTLRVSSALGQRRLCGESLTRTTFAQLSLREPPASVESTPRDAATEIRLGAVLQEFRLVGNFFHATVDGGVLERRNAPLELGEEYFLVTQRRLELPIPSGLEIIQHRADRSWTAYRLRLRDDAKTRNDDIPELRSFLGREIVPSRPRVEVIWPPPCRFDLDGARVYRTTTSQLIVRSDSEPPKYESATAGAAEVAALGEDLYSVDLKFRDGEAVVWLPGGSLQRLRFEDSGLVEPESIYFKSGNELMELYAPQAGDLARSTGPIEIRVPAERLWRRVRIGRLPLRPIPHGHVHSIDGPVLADIDAGAFGSIHVARTASGEETRPPWYSRFEKLIVGIAGPAASKRLCSVRTKGQLVRWAAENKAQPILPLMLLALSAEVDRGIS